MLTKKTLQTPFGSLDIDQQHAAHIAQHLRLEQSRNEKQFLQDLLPVSQFLIHTFPETKIISIMLGAYELDLAVNLAKFLTNISAEVAPILIAFSKLDKQSLDELEFGNSLRFYSYAKKYHTEYPDLILPFAPIISALEFSNLKGGYNFTPIVDYYDHVSQGGQQIFSTTAMFWHYEPPNLGQTQKKELITLGFDAIREYLSSGTVPRYTPKDEILKRKSGVFVTIRQNSNLRGCIGTLKADQPLYVAVQNMAIAAATSDPRFPPLQPQELSQVSIKIAVLSALQKLEIDQIEVGRHGLLIEHQGRRGVLLPEVPLDRGWDKDTFLAHLCLKAGL